MFYLVVVLIGFKFFFSGKFVNEWNFKVCFNNFLSYLSLIVFCVNKLWLLLKWVIYFDIVLDGYYRRIYVLIIVIDVLGLDV